MRSLNRAARCFAMFLPLAVLAFSPGAVSGAPKPAPKSAAKPAPKPAAKPAARPAAKPAATGPWLYRGSDIPQDKAWNFGELANGLRYAVRKNGVPPGQVSIRIYMDVGSLHETDSERGYAHLLEHLVFRQSRYLGEAEAIPTWQRLGATFGSDTNASTSPVSTTFKLDLPNARPAALDESFKLLSGMMIAPTLSEANVRTEVPIVLAEKRERGGTAERVGEAIQQTFYAGQRLASRAPIGTVETLQAANQTSVRAFHARWYRPENAVIVAVGDADPAMLSGLIAKYFADWKGAGPRVPAPAFGDPVAPKGADPANPVGETRVIVEPELPRTFSYAVMRPWRQVTDTVAYNQGVMTGEVALAIINRRLESRARAGGSFLGAVVSREKIERSADATYVQITPTGEDWQKALAEVRAVIADALAKPPSQEEVAREVAEINVIFENGVEQSALQNGSTLADDMTRALDIRETIASPETVLAIYKQSIPLFTPAAIHRETQKLFKGAVVRSAYVTPKAGEADAAALRTALALPVKADPKARPDGKPISFAELPPIGTPAANVTDLPTGLLEISQLDFGNGVKALIWPTKDEPGRVRVKVRFGAGYRAFGPGDAAYIQLGELALVSSGQGTLGAEELDRVSTGRKFGFDFAIDDGTFELGAETRGSDLADQLYLFAAKFAMPRWDVNPFLRAKASALQNYDSFASSPQGVLSRDFGTLQHGGDPRFAMPTPREIEAATPEGFRQVWQPILEQGPIEVQIYGDFDRAGAIEALRKTFGALPPRPLLSGAALATRFAEPNPGAAPIVLTHRGDLGQAAAVISWPTGGGMADIAESRQLEILTNLFQIRLLDALRERLGEAYSPQVINDWPVDVDNGGSVFALANLQPKTVPLFFATADQIAADMAARPPTADELDRVLEPMRQQLARATTGSAFFMGHLEGATQDPRRFSALRSLLSDYTRTTPEAMQALAKKYFTPARSWRVAVIPEGQTLATTVPATAGGEGR